MAEQHCYIAQLVVFVSMDGFIVLGESLLKEVAPQSINFSEALANHAKEFGVCLFLRATLHNHGGKLRLLPCRKVDLHQLVDSFLRVGAGHDGEVNGPAQVDKVGIGLIFDLHGLCFLILLVFGGTFVFVFVVIFIVAALAQDLSPKLLVCLFMLFPL